MLLCQFFLNKASGEGDKIHLDGLLLIYTKWLFVYYYLSCSVSYNVWKGLVAAEINKLSNIANIRHLKLSDFKEMFFHCNKFGKLGKDKEENKITYNYITQEKTYYQNIMDVHSVFLQYTCMQNEIG